MTMAIDNQQRFGGINFDHMPYTNPPQFSDPWTSQSRPTQNQNIYAQSHALNNSVGLEGMAKQQAMGSYAGVPISAASAGSSLLAEMYPPQVLLTHTQDLLSPVRPGGFSNEAVYGNAPSPVHSNYPPTSSPYDTMGYAPAPVRTTYAISHEDTSRRLSSTPSVASSSSSYPDMSEETQSLGRQNSLIDFHDRGMQNDQARGFGDAIDASRGMIAMSQNTTPRNIYGAQGRGGRGSGDSYGFPPTHSSSSSVSSSSNYPSYFGGSVDSSVSDYSNAGSDIESVSSRTLPRPSGFAPSNGLPPAPQSMMGQFSSKVSSSTQKKHKCKVCDKRFTRPSSLQTHMYSHTGEKRKSSQFMIRENKD
jgi:hypothetical protein